MNEDSNFISGFLKRSKWVTIFTFTFFSNITIFTLIFPQEYLHLIFPLSIFIFNFFPPKHIYIYMGYIILLLSNHLIKIALTTSTVQNPLLLPPLGRLTPTALSLPPPTGDADAQASGGGKGRVWLALVLCWFCMPS